MRDIDMIQRLIKSNERLIQINSQLVEVNRNFGNLTIRLLDALKEAKKESGEVEDDESSRTS